MTSTRTAQAALAAAVLVGVLTGCAAIAQDPAVRPAAVASTTAPAVQTPAPVETPPAVVAPAAPVADANSQIVAGVLYQGTASAPVRIGTDTPGAAPAAEAGFPSMSNFDAFKAASIALGPVKYTVVVNAKFSDGSSAKLGYMWQVFRTNEYGHWTAAVKHGDTETFPTQQAAIGAPKSLDGRTLDRAEYVLVVGS